MGKTRKVGCTTSDNMAFFIPVAKI